jgi:hypothetical protein
MNSLSKILAIVFLAAGAAIVSSSAPSGAQAARAAGLVAADAGATGPCCRLATKRIFTGSPGWTGLLPNNTPFNPVVVNPIHSLWQTVPGSQWIANSAGAGANGQEKPGTYIYSYHFCLCGLPSRIQQVPASLSLRIFADDDFVAKLNSVPIAQKTGGWGFNSPPGGTVANVVSTNFKPCDNVLTFEVHNAPNMLSPTGLDVAGTISGYFRDQPFDVPCPCNGRPVAD